MVYNEGDFERIFRMPRIPFNIIYENLHDRCLYNQRRDETCKAGIYPKISSINALRIFVYRMTFNYRVDSVKCHVLRHQILLSLSLTKKSPSLGIDTSATQLKMI